MPDPKQPASHPTAAVIIPVFNERLNSLSQLVKELLHFTQAIILVDDGSDPPVTRIDEKVILIRHKRNLGQGAALETGMEYARRMGFEIVVHIDGDGQHQVQELPLLVAPLLKGDADIVFGSRFITRSSEELIPFSRRQLLRFSRIANTFFTGAKMTDAHNGFRALNKKALDALKLRSTGRAHASEIVWLANKHDLRFVEVPVHVLYNETAKNKIHFLTLISLGIHLTWNRLTGYRNKNRKAIKEREAALAAIMKRSSVEQ